MRGLCIAALIAAGPAAAQEVNCATTMNQLELNQCEYGYWQEVDAELNAAYEEALAKAQARDAEPGGGGAEDLLRAAQRAWIAYRDADCEVEASIVAGGQAEPMVRYGCMGQHSEARTQILLDYLDR